MTVLERLLKKMGLKDFVLVKSWDDASEVRLKIAYPEISMQIQSFVHSSSNNFFTFKLSKKMLETMYNTCFTIEQMLYDGYGISALHRSESFQDEMLDIILSTKKTDDAMYVDKYVNDGCMNTWHKMTVIPAVPSLDALKIWLDLEEVA